MPDWLVLLLVTGAGIFYVIGGNTAAGLINRSHWSISRAPARRYQFYYVRAVMLALGSWLTVMFLPQRVRNAPPIRPPSYRTPSRKDLS